MMNFKNARSTSNIRNERVERIVDFSLKLVFSDKDKVQRRIKVGPEGFQTEFDHFIEMKGMKIYGQSTCYKERGLSGGEPNKTYEMRETLMEYLLVFLNGLRDKSIDFNHVRFFHVVIGDPTYSYSYFQIIRNETYDLNIEVNFKDELENFYNELEMLIPESIFNNDTACLLALESVYKSTKNTLVKKAINQISNKLDSYIKRDCPPNPNGKILREAINYLIESRLPFLDSHLSKKLSGAGIKENYLKDVKSDMITDHKSKAVVDTIFSLRPFLPEAKKALNRGKNGWDAYIDSIFKRISSVTNLNDAIQSLWSLTDPGEREISRRLLIKIPGIMSTKGVFYPQDIPIKGVNEHNLYAGEFDAHKTQEITIFISSKFRNAKILDAKHIKEAFLQNGRQIIKDGFEYDIKNGTVIQPVLYYLINVLELEGYQLRSSKDVLGETIKGFHSKLFNIDAGHFSSLQFIEKDGKPIALIKAKYFRKEEFDRRVKEEGFVSLMSFFTFRDGVLAPYRPEFPRIMFIDTNKDWQPNRVSLEILYLLGWDIFFDIDELINYLQTLIIR